MDLFPHQRQSAERHVLLLRERYVTADRSETGTGKTLSILEAVKSPELCQTSFAVVCPKSVKSHWRHWIGEMALEDRCLGVLGWEEAKLGCRPRIYSSGKSGCGWFEGDRDTRRLIIFDEAHRAKSRKTIASEMVSCAVKQGHVIALLSATLIQSTLDLGGLGYPLRLIAHPRFWFDFARQFGARFNVRFRHYEDISSRTQQNLLHALLDRVSVRVLKSDIAPQMCLTRVDLVDAVNVEEINAAYAELKAEIDTLENLGATTAEVLVARLRGRQAVELAKVKIFAEEAARHLEEGAKVVVFLNFNQSIQWLEEFFREKFIPLRTITGETPEKSRNQFINEFSSNGISALLLNIQAGSEGISLHDTIGNAPRVALISPPESAGTLLQALGRIDRVGAKSVGLNRILYVADTAEEDVYENVARKINRLSTLNDGELRSGPPHSREP